MATPFKKFAFMAIGALVGGLVEGGLTVADDQRTRKKLGLPKDATDEEVRNLLRDNSQQVNGLSPEANNILKSLDIKL